MTEVLLLCQNQAKNYEHRIEHYSHGDGIRVKAKIHFSKRPPASEIVLPSISLSAKRDDKEDS